MTREILLWLCALIAGVLIAVFVLASDAAAQMQPPGQQHVLCAPRRELLEAFKATHGQQEQWIGKAGEDGVLVLLGDKDGNWSLFVVKPDFACLFGAGDGSTLLFGEPT